MKRKEPRWTVDVKELLPEGRVLKVDLSEKPGAGVFFVRINVEKLPPGAIRLPDKSVLLGFLNLCTHMGCRLFNDEHDCLLEYSPSPHPSAVVGPCPCHGTTFDLTRAGLVVFGPATQDLSQLELSINENLVTGVLTSPNDTPFYEQWPVKESI